MSAASITARDAALCIFVSRSLGDDRAVRALHDGATDYIAKHRPTRLPSVVERAIRERDPVHPYSTSAKRFQYVMRPAASVVITACST